MWLPGIGAGLVVVAAEVAYNLLLVPATQGNLNLPPIQGSAGYFGGLCFAALGGVVGAATKSAKDNTRAGPADDERVALVPHRAKETYRFGEEASKGSCDMVKMCMGYTDSLYNVLVLQKRTDIRYCANIHKILRRKKPFYILILSELDIMLKMKPHVDYDCFLVDFYQSAVLPYLAVTADGYYFYHGLF